MSLHARLRKNKKINDKIKSRDEQTEYISTGVLSLNLLHSGSIRKGIIKGAVTMISADSSLGKSFIGLSTLKEAQAAGMECMVIDSEKCFDYQWAETIGIDTSEEKLTVIRTANIIEIKQIVSQMVDGLSLKERQNIFVLLDSWGTLVTPTIISKALDGSETKDMSLPVWKNELANVLKETDATFYVINHVYANTGGFGDPLAIPGGKRLYFNCDSVVLGASRRKDKEQQDIAGMIVTAKVAKGRKAVEHSKLEYRIRHEGGLDPWYGLLGDAIEAGHVVKPTQGYYSRPCVSDDKKWREKEIYTADFWIEIFKNTTFELFLENKYSFKGRELFITDEVSLKDLPEFVDDEV